MSYTTLLVDFDGVIRRWSIDEAAIELRHGLPQGLIRRVVFSEALLLPAINGLVTDQTWRDGAAIELQRQCPASSASQAVAQWSASPGELDVEVLAILAERDPGLRLVLATNATSRLASDLDALGLANYFDVIANSSELKVAKPSAEFFHAALARAGARPAEALFIDDSLANVAAAAAIGMRAHHFTGREAMSAFLRDARVLADSAPQSFTPQ